MGALLLTRTAEKNKSDQKEHFAHYSGAIFSVPLIEIRPCFCWNENRLAELKASTWLIFSSQYGVHSFFQQSQQTPLKEEIQQQLQSKKFACIGQKTAQALAHYGYSAHFIPPRANIRSLVQTWPKSAQKEEKVLWVNGDQLAHAYDLSPTKAKDWTMYQNCCPKGAAIRLRQVLQQEEITAYFVSSPSIWWRFYEISTSLISLDSLQYFVLGEKTAQAIRSVVPQAQLSFLKKEI